MDKSKSSSFNKEDYVTIAFSKKQVSSEYASEHNDETILVNVWLPRSSKYANHYITLKKDTLKEDKFSRDMYIAYLHKSQKKNAIMFNKEREERHEIMLSAQELKEEFDSWRKKSTPKENEKLKSEVEKGNADAKEIEYSVM